MSGAKRSICFSSHNEYRRRRRRENDLKARVAVKALAPLLVTIVMAWPISASADPVSPSAYRQAVESAISIVSAANAGDLNAAQNALNALQAGTGTSQPEIAADLKARPPDFQDANARLHSLLDALAAPASTSDPAKAQQQLNQVIAQHRYDALRQPPSLLDRFGQWVRDRINEVLRFLFGRTGNGLGIPTVYFYIVGAAALALAAFVIFRATRGRLAATSATTAHFGPSAPADFFAEADRLAAAGDLVGAIRALCAGVAGTLAGEQTWEGSPLTVREIFQNASEPERLKPLLLPFEAAVYGGRDVDAATYGKAELAAAPFRKRVEEAAA